MEAGELLELAAWLRDNLYSLGPQVRARRRRSSGSRDATIDPQPYLAYLRDKLATLPAGV
jgi:hypothetical protein